MILWGKPFIMSIGFNSHCINDNYIKLFYHISPPINMPTSSLIKLCHFFNFNHDPWTCLEQPSLTFEFILQTLWTQGVLKVFKRPQVWLATWKPPSFVHWSSTSFKYSMMFFLTHTLECPWLWSLILWSSNQLVLFFFQDSLTVLVDGYEKLLMNCLL